MTTGTKSPVKTGALRAKAALARAATGDPALQSAGTRKYDGKGAAKRSLNTTRMMALKAGGDTTAYLADSATVFRLAPNERIRIFKEGVAARHLDHLSARMRTSKEFLVDTLRLSRATVSRKARAEEALSQDESERVLGMEALIGQVEVMLQESGDGQPFDAAAWVASWLQRPVPALGGKKPAEYMDSVEGQKLVAHTLAMAQSGAYA